MLLRFTVFSVLILFLVPGEALARTVDKRFHESFDVSPGVTLFLDHGDGDVTITPWDQDVVDVEIRYQGEIKGFGFGEKMDFQVKFHQSKSRVEVIGHEKGTASIGFMYRNLKHYSYTVHAPAYAMLELEGDDGDVRIEDWGAEITVRLDDGDLTLTNSSGERTDLRLEDGDARIAGVRGHLLVETDDGDIVLSDSEITRGKLKLEDGDLILRECRGNFQINVDDGDITMSRVKLGTAAIRSEDGDLELALLKSDDMDLEIVTGDGSVNLVLENGISAKLSIRTDDGRISVDLPEVMNLERGSHHVTGDILSGKGKIQVNTDDGNVTVRGSGRQVG